MACCRKWPKPEPLSGVLQRLKTASCAAWQQCSTSNSPPATRTCGLLSQVVLLKHTPSSHQTEHSTVHSVNCAHQHAFRRQLRVGPHSCSCYCITIGGSCHPCRMCQTPVGVGHVQSVRSSGSSAFQFQFIQHLHHHNTHSHSCLLSMGQFTPQHTGSQTTLAHCHAASANASCQPASASTQLQY